VAAGHALGTLFFGTLPHALPGHQARAAGFSGFRTATIVGDDFRWLNDNLRLVHADLRGTKDGFKLVRKLPHVRTPDGAIAPRVVALAAGYLATTSYEFSVNSLNAYVQAFQQSTVLRMVELWALVPALKLVLLEEIAARGSKVAADPAGSYGAGICVRSLRDIGQTSWKEVLEPLVLFDRILRQDPAGAYARMDFESRDLYRTEVANIAEYAELPEAMWPRQRSPWRGPRTRKPTPARA
jgi:cyclic beta-1,2-glucan synthetase